MRLGRPIAAVFRRLGPKGAVLERKRVRTPDAAADTVDTVTDTYPVVLMPILRRQRPTGGTLELTTGERWSIAADGLAITPRAGDVLVVAGRRIALGPEVELLRQPDGVVIGYAVMGSS